MYVNPADTSNMTDISIDDVTTYFFYGIVKSAGLPSS